MDEVIVQTTIDDVINPNTCKACVECQQINRLFECPLNIYDSSLDIARRRDLCIQGIGIHRIIFLDECLFRIESINAVKRLWNKIVATGLDQTVIAEDSVFSVAARDPVASCLAVEIIIFTVTEKDIVTGHSVDDVVSAFTVDEITNTSCHEEEAGRFIIRICVGVLVIN